MADDVAAARHDLRALDALPANGGLGCSPRSSATTSPRRCQEAERFWYRFPVTPFNLLPLSTYREPGVSTPSCGRVRSTRFLGLLDDYVAIVAQLRVTLAEQRERGARGSLPDELTAQTT